MPSLSQIATLVDPDSLTSRKNILSAALGTDIFNPMHFGAAGDGSDDSDAIEECWAACQAARGTMIFPALPFGISRTWNIAAVAQASIIMPQVSNIRGSVLGTESGLVWVGGNDDVMVEVENIQRCNISLNLTNRPNAATGITGMLWHNSDGTGTAQNHNRFPHISVAGCDLAMHWGDYTNDGYDSNLDDNFIEFVYLYDNKNGLLIDSAGQDNNVVGYFHMGGALSFASRTREYNIRTLRNGIGFRIMDGFMRGDKLIADAAAIDIQDNSVRIDKMSFESTETDILPISVTSSTGRDMVILNGIVMSNDIRDSNGDCIVIDYQSGASVSNSELTGNVTVTRPVGAVDNVFTDGYGFIRSGTKAAMVEVALGYRANSATAMGSVSGTVKANGFINNVSALQESQNIFVNMELGGTYQALLDANRTLVNPTNVVEIRDIGRVVRLRITADGTNRVITPQSHYRLAGGASTFTVNANTTTIIQFEYYGSSVWDEIGRVEGIT